MNHSHCRCNNCTSSWQCSCNTYNAGGGCRPCQSCGQYDPSCRIPPIKPACSNGFAQLEDSGNCPIYRCISIPVGYYAQDTGQKDEFGNIIYHLSLCSTPAYPSNCSGYIELDTSGICPVYTCKTIPNGYSAALTGRVDQYGNPIYELISCSTPVYPATCSGYVVLETTNGCPTYICKPIPSGFTAALVGYDQYGNPIYELVACPPLQVCPAGTYSTAGIPDANGCPTNICTPCPPPLVCPSGTYSTAGAPDGNGCPTNFCTPCPDPATECPVGVTGNVDYNGCPCTPASGPTGPTGPTGPSGPTSPCPPLQVCPSGSYSTAGPPDASGCPTNVCTPCPDPATACPVGTTGAVDANGCPCTPASGPTGPTGPTGPSGPTGSTGPCSPPTGPAVNCIPPTITSCPSGQCFNSNCLNGCLANTCTPVPTAEACPTPGAADTCTACPGPCNTLPNGCVTHCTCLCNSTDPNLATSGAIFACETAPYPGAFACTPSVTDPNSCAAQSVYGTLSPTENMLQCCPAYATMASEILDLMNQQRARYGLCPLVMDTTLTNMALWKAQNMAADYAAGKPPQGSCADGTACLGECGECGVACNYDPTTSAPLNECVLCPTQGAMSHAANIGGVGMCTWQYAQQQGIMTYDFTNAGENIAAFSHGFESACQFMAQWNSDCGHLNNLLNPNYKSVGIGISYATSPSDPQGLAFAAQEFSTVAPTLVC